MHCGRGGQEDPTLGEAAAVLNTTSYTESPEEDVEKTLSHTHIGMLTHTHTSALPHIYTA